MGITGLLPLLKPIQRQKHLSEFAGQTLAVDAYVWLHRGTYACAPELVQGRPTRKYVDYCMHRVRLLRHHHISPFLVFDGGPLPAKQGTEKEREKKRADNVKRANELSAQGKESQAREYYVKCVDVTPQMAYQVIKALKAEGVPYIVAPYEADAQLAYLERIGLVDGIITEDSDLLVFGCRNVLFKLDPVSSTITNISRSEFGSPALASDSLSLVGWSDAQFRWMAMLSGCDYLPSISGIGLKTAWQLIKRHKTVDKVVKMIRLEGKKDVPRRYLDAFYLAEKVFLHQRVYDPGLEKLVYLTNPSDDLDLSEEAESYIGRDLDPSLAKRIAEGDACPISLADMEDINPSFTPKAIKPLPLQSRDTNSTKTPKGKQLAKGVGLLSFFSATTKTPPTQQKPCPTKRRSNGIVTGDASGKRTLMDVMEQDVATKRKKVEAEAEKKHECQTLSKATRKKTLHLKGVRGKKTRKVCSTLLLRKMDTFPRRRAYRVTVLPTSHLLSLTRRRHIVKPRSP
ncbi:PIN domain-like protein [Phellopilus nigrolimitatus]|nr:PIN domain-like protein [Phellopilus nigrolimitatus]